MSHAFMAYGSGSLSQPFLHSPNLKAIQKSSPSLCDPLDKEDDRIGFSCYLFHVKQLLEGPDPVFKKTPGWSITFLK